MPLYVARVVKYRSGRLAWGLSVNGYGWVGVHKCISLHTSRLSSVILPVTVVVATRRTINSAIKETEDAPAHQSDLSMSQNLVTVRKQTPIAKMTLDIVTKHLNPLGVVVLETPIAKNDA